METKKLEEIFNVKKFNSLKSYFRGLFFRVKINVAYFLYSYCFPNSATFQEKECQGDYYGQNRLQP